MAPVDATATAARAAIWKRIVVSDQQRKRDLELRRDAKLANRLRTDVFYIVPCVCGREMGERRLAG